MNYKPLRQMAAYRDGPGAVSEAPGERRGGAHSGRRPHAGMAEAARTGPASASPKHSKDTLKAVKRHFAELIH